MNVQKQKLEQQLWDVANNSVEIWMVTISRARYDR